MDALRWVGAILTALILSAAYATGFFYTHPAIIVVGFLFCLTALFAPTLLRTRGRGASLFAAALVSIGLIAAQVSVQWLFHPMPISDLVKFGLLSGSGLQYLLPVLALLFFGTILVSLFVPRRHQ